MTDSTTTAGHWALIAADHSARELHAEFVEPEHLLIGMIASSDTIAGQALLSMKVTHSLLREGIELDPLNIWIGDPVYSHVSYAITKQSMREAHLTGSNYVGPEHILLAILNRTDNSGCRLLIELGVDLDKLRDKVIELIDKSRRDNAVCNYDLLKIQLQSFLDSSDETADLATRTFALAARTWLASQRA